LRREKLKETIAKVLSAFSFQLSAQIAQSSKVNAQREKQQKPILSAFSFQLSTQIAQSSKVKAQRKHSKKQYFQPEHNK